MNKLFSKIATLSVGLAMAIGVGVAVGSRSAKVVKAADVLSYTLDFKANSTDTDNNTALGNTVADYFTDGASYVTSLSSSKVYLGKSSMNGLKFGSSSAKGTLTLNLAASGQVKATKITLALAMFDSGKKVNVSINGATSGTGYSQLSPGTSLSDYDVAWDGETNLSTISIEAKDASKCRFYLDYIKVFVDDGGGSCDHNWVAGTVHAATCTVDGYTEYECSLCHDTKTDDVVPAFGHDYGDWAEVTPATCLVAGEERRVCSHDSTHVETRPIAALGHSYVNGVCERCGAIEPNEKTVGYVFSEHYSEDTEIEGETIYLDENVSVVFVKGSNATKYYANGTAVRWYGGGTLTISSSSGHIQSIDITYSGKHDNSVSADVGSYTDITTASGTATWVGDSEEVIFTQSGTSGHDRISELSITYAESVDPSKKNMIIYTSGNLADGATLLWSSTAGTHTFSAKEEETPVSGVTWSVSDTTVATIVASTGAMTTVKPGNVVVYAEAEGYNKASAAIEISKSWVEELEISGSMSKKSYTTAESWSATGFTVTASYHSGWEEDVTSSVEWSFNPAAPADGVTSVVATAILDEESVSSPAQAVTVTVAHAGTESDPFTVAEALAKCTEIGTVGNKGQGPWVTTGIITRITEAPVADYWNATYWISDDGTQTNELQVYRGFYIDNAKFDATTAALLTAGKIVTITGNLTGSYGCEYCQGNYMLSLEEPETGDVDVTFVPASTSFEVGATGTFTASSETSGAEFSWSVDNSSVLSVDETTGAYEALSAGNAQVTVTASAGGKEGHVSVNFTVNGSASSALTVAEARALAVSLPSGQTTSYYVYVEGFVKEFATSVQDSDITKPRALDIMSEDESAKIMVYTNVKPYAAFVEGLNLGDRIVVKANVQNYNGTYELTSPERISYAPSAISFAFELLEQTGGQCATYVDKESDYDEFKTFFEGKWSDLKTLYNSLSSGEDGEKIKIANAERNESGTTLEQAVARYDFLTGKYQLDNFAEGRTPIVPAGAYANLSLEGNPTIFIVVAIATASTLAFTLLLVFKKKKQK